MNRFSYLRAASVDEAVREVAADPTATLHRRRHQPHRPDEVQCRAAGRGSSTSPACPLNGIEETDGGGLTIGALVTNDEVAYDPRIQDRVSAAFERDPGGRLAAAAQRGHHGRQPAAAHPLLLFLRHRHALQQARARLGLPRSLRAQPHPRDPRHERALHRHPSVRHVRSPWRRLEAIVHVAGPDGERTIPIRRVPSPAGRPRRRSTPPCARARSSRRSSSRRRISAGTTPT